MRLHRIGLPRVGYKYTGWVTQAGYTRWVTHGRLHKVGYTRWVTQGGLHMAKQLERDRLCDAPGPLAPLDLVVMASPTNSSEDLREGIEATYIYIYI